MILLRQSAAQEADIVKGSLVYIKSEGDKNHARERYIVVDVDDSSCTVQKFVKSQLRSKQYHLKLTEVYPVSPELIEMSGRIRDLDLPESEVEEVSHQTSEVQTNPEPALDYCPQYEVSVPAEVVSEVVVDTRGGEGVVDTIVCDPVTTVVESDVPLAPVVNEPPPAMAAPRRSKREAAKPSWMLSGDYEVDM